MTVDEEINSRKFINIEEVKLIRDRLGVLPSFLSDQIDKNSENTD